MRAHVTPWLGRLQGAGAGRQAVRQNAAISRLLQGIDRVRRQYFRDYTSFRHVSADAPMQAYEAPNENLTRLIVLRRPKVF